MNQIAAAILVLSASITGYAAAVRPAGDNYGLMMTLIALGLGLWGALALLTSTTHDEYELEEDGFGRVSRRVMPPVNLLNRTTQRYAPAPVVASRPRVDDDYGYRSESPLTSLQTRTRTSLADEAMRHDLQRYSSSRVA
ncbi:MAG: hypothetical protein AAF497_16340 [Planctomycetota bacterium]